MNIELHEITVREVFEGYKDSAEEGVKGYGGRLNIRPAYQREFVYGIEKRNKVIDTVRRNFPLNVMYWVKNSDEDFELLDGQQRTISLCQYCNGDFSIPIEDADGKKRPKGFTNLTETEKNQILDYKLMIYICEGNDKEKLAWFQTINIAGEKLTDQELNNAMYTGPWLTEAKKYFSKNQCPAWRIAEKYLTGSPIRQDYLETVLKWISSRDKKEITDYMREHQHDDNCAELWQYFQSVINWVQMIFPKYRKEMKGRDWGTFYNKYRKNEDGTDRVFDSTSFEKRIVELMEDEDVTNNSGIYEYLLSGDERHLSIRAFTPKMARAAYERQKGVCPICKNTFAIEQMQADHITPWSKGGHTTADNCQMLCADCNRRKSDI